MSIYTITGTDFSGGHTQGGKLKELHSFNRKFALKAQICRQRKEHE